MCNKWKVIVFSVIKWHQINKRNGKYNLKKLWNSKLSANFIQRPTCSSQISSSHHHKGNSLSRNNFRMSRDTLPVTLNREFESHCKSGVFCVSSCLWASFRCTKCTKHCLRCKLWPVVIVCVWTIVQVVGDQLGQVCEGDLLCFGRRYPRWVLTVLSMSRERVAARQFCAVSCQNARFCFGTRFVVVSKQSSVLCQI